MSHAAASQMKNETLINDLCSTLPDGLITEISANNIYITGMDLDSRKIQDGYLFAAFQGEVVNGYDFIPQAVKNGAAVVLINTTDPAPTDIPFIRTSNPRLAFSLLAAAFHQKQPEHMIAVTGTNGKTSIVQFCRQIWETLDFKPACLGTIGVTAPALGIDEEGSITTPDPETLFRTYADLTDLGCTHLAMEASSHGLDQYRLHGTRIQSAGFSNLSHDHLDYHKTVEDYLNAKTKLFTEILPKDGIAVLNCDDPVFPHLQEQCHKTITYSLGAHDADLKILERTPTAQGQHIILQAFGETYELDFPLVGAFQLYNALCAVGLVMTETSLNKARVIACLEGLQTVRGRLEYVGSPDGIDAGIYVDYAHTPDAIVNVLKALRPHTDGKLYALIGCGGDRDNTKRPLMGKAAAEHADCVIVTDDNPRSEEPAQIREQAMKGCPNAENIGNRRKAIYHGIQQLKDGDILVITGKGHEQGQKIGDTIHPFDDATVARDALQGD